MEFRELTADAFERLARRQVAAAFEANRTSPTPSREIPVIDWMHGYFDYDPQGSRADHAELEALVVRALIARKWFEDQLPNWMKPLELPLNEAERTALYDRGDRRFWTVASYAMTLQAMHWDLSRVPSFLDFYAKSVNAPTLNAI